MIFSVLDANHRLWQVQLDEESSKLCAFKTILGCIASGENHLVCPQLQKCIFFPFLTEGLDGVNDIVDDITWTRTIYLQH